MFSLRMPRRARAFMLGILATRALVAAAPCDIYASGGTPCVAAHSTTRALYSNYTGPLYQVKRASDNTTTGIGPIAPGGVANAATQDTFCARTTCLITIIYDQSSSGNHLTQAPPGGFKGPEAGGYDRLSSAIGAPVTLNGQKAYGVFISPGGGYRNNAAKGTATGDVAQGMYAVLDGTHYNGGCCFDYGNAETNSRDTGNGHMEAIYYGNCKSWGTGAGRGPWIMADLENGLFSGRGAGANTANPSVTYRFVNAVVKGKANVWAIRGADATTGALSTYYNGARPSGNGYNPMHKEGAIILGIGGDNSVSAQGTFYEGVMTSGYPTDDTENAVQADIVAAKYATAALTNGPVVNVGSAVSLRTTTSNRYISHTGSTVNTQAVSSSSSTTLKEQATWIVRTGLGNTACFSFESKDTPGNYIRHENFKLVLSTNDSTQQFQEDATFCPEAGLNGQGNSIRSWNYPTHYFLYRDNVAFATNNGDANDASWVIGTAFTEV